jgi:type IV secretion system protein VirB9
MIWFAAMMMVAQAAGAPVASTGNALTAQQIQELSSYNFKGAGVALSGQANQTPSKSNSLAPIPALQVPPITSRIAAVQPTSAGHPADKGSEVPLNWKPPHAELNAAAISATALSRQWETGVATPTPGADGRVVYVFEKGMPVMVCAPLRVSAVEVQAGEHLQSEPQIGDSRRWEITPVMSGSGLDITPLLIVKPIEPGLETDLIDPTDRRTYVIRLVSDPTRFVSRLAFQYSAESSMKWATFQAQQDAAKRDAEALAEQERARINRPESCRWWITPSIICISITSSAATRPSAPIRILDDGQHTYSIYPNDGRFRELPTLLMMVNDKTELVNFRVSQLPRRRIALHRRPAL